jgi:hypothetical protein
MSDLVEHDAEARFESVLVELTRIKDDFVVRKLNWYKEHGWRPRWLFRVSGVLIILLSISIPFLTTLEGVWKTVVLPAFALVVAGLTGLTSFFRWESDWKGFRQTQFALEYLLAEWELKILAARHQADKQQAIAMAVEATQQLIASSHKMTSSEVEEFFKRVQIPPTQQR